MDRPFNTSVQIFLFSSVGLIVLPHLANIPASIFGFFALLLAWRFAGIWKPQYLPNSTVLLALSMGGLALLYSQHHGLFGRDAGTRLFILGLGLKLMEIKSERDLYLIAYLAFIVAASLFLYEQSLLMAAYIIFVCCVLFATLVCLNSRHPKPRQALAAAGTIVAQAIPMAIALFVLFPRLEAPRWMWLHDDQTARSGLSDSMEPGSISNLGLSDELAFRAKFSGKLPPARQLYWRGPVFSYTDGKRWSQAANLNYARFMDKLTFSGDAYQYTLLMEPQNKNWVFALDMPVEYYGALRQNVNYQLLTNNNPDKRAEYKITSYPNYNTGYITRSEYRDATQLPHETSSKIKQLVARLHGFDSKPETFIEQLLNHFRQEDFHYTLTPPALENNPIETFLFESRQGFCSHYASAFVYLMRVANIPARVVTGYQGGEFNPVGGFVEVRQANAHAWAEVWLENRGWVRVDPTAAIAPERIERGLDTSRLRMGGLISYLPATTADGGLNWLKEARQLLSNIDYNWQRWVINYNTDNQTKFLSSFGINGWLDIFYWLGGLLTAFTLITSWLVLYQKRTKTDPALRYYQQFCQKLAKQGFNKHPGEGEQHFAGRAANQFPAQAAQIEQITRTFQKLRYGRHAHAEDLETLGQQVATFKI